MQYTYDPTKTIAHRDNGTAFWLLAFVGSDGTTIIKRQIASDTPTPGWFKRTIAQFEAQFAAMDANADIIDASPDVSKLEDDPIAPDAGGRMAALAALNAVELKARIAATSGLDPTVTAVLTTDADRVIQEATAAVSAPAKVVNG